MMSEDGVRKDRLETLVLARLLAGPKEGTPRQEICGELADLLGEAERDRTRAMVALVISDLCERKALEEKKERLRLRAAGRQLVREALDLHGEEAEDDLDWEMLQLQLLACGPLAIEEPEPETLERLATPDGLRAYILKQHYKLPLRALCPSLPEVRDALAWLAIGRAMGRQLDFAGRRKFGTGPVVQVVLNTLLDGEREYETRSVLTMLAMRAVDARNGTLPEMKRALLGRWLGERVEEPPSLDDEERFVQELRAVTRRARSGRFGSNKVFIGHVFREMRKLFGPELSREDFEKRLIEAHTQHEVTLSRADLVEAMNPQDVRESEVRHLNSRFHFVRI